jgi:preprotein translocase subunit SecE
MAVAEQPKDGFFTRMGGFYAEVKSEMRKVTWPTRGELYGATLVVMAVTILLCLMLGITDSVLGWLIEHLMTSRG